MDSLSTVDNAVDLLFHLAGEPGSRGVTALSGALGLPKTTTHRLLATLARRGLVERDGRGRYRPGVALVTLGRGVLERDPIVAAARPDLQSEAEELGETVFLTAARAGRILVLDKAEGRGFLRAAPRVGEEVPVHATAVGKLQLAFAPESVAEVPGERERFTEHTASSDLAIAREVAQAQQQGYASNRGEWVPGLAVVAAPVFAGRRLAGALALATTVHRMRELGTERVAGRMRAAASRVGARLDGAVAPQEET